MVTPLREEGNHLVPLKTDLSKISASLNESPFGMSGPIPAKKDVPDESDYKTNQKTESQFVDHYYQDYVPLVYDEVLKDRDEVVELQN